MDYHVYGWSLLMKKVRVNTLRKSMLLAIYALATDCFELQTFAGYLTQRYRILFQATPSKKLTGSVKNLCEQVIKQQTYNLYVKLGNVSFMQPNLTYDPSKSIEVEVPCADPSNCTPSSVDSIQTATYEMQFTQLDLTLSSIVNTYELRKFVHTDCMRSVAVYYDAVKPEMYIEMLDEVKQCPSNMITLTQSVTLPNQTEIKANVYVQTIVSDKSLRVSKYEQKQNWSNRFTFRDQTFTNSTSNLSAFWQNIQRMGPYDKSLSIMPDLLYNFKNDAILKMQFKISLLTTIEQGRNSTTPPNNQSYYYEQTSSFYVTELKNLLQPSCYNNISVEMHRKFFVLKASLQENLTNCSRQYVEQKANNTYDQIRFMIIVSQNKDKTGFNYNYSFNIPNFEIGNDINEQVPCLSEDDCNNFSKVIDLQQQLGNVSILMKMMYLNNGDVILAGQYNPDFTLSPFGPSNVALLNRMICIDFQPLTVGSSVIIYTIYQQQFRLSQYTNLQQTQYCSDLTSEQQSTMSQIISKMAKVVDSSGYISLTIDNRIIGQLKTEIYDVPKGNYKVWIIVIVFSIASIVSSVPISLKIKFPE